MREKVNVRSDRYCRYRPQSLCDVCCCARQSAVGTERVEGVVVVAASARESDEEDHYSRLMKNIRRTLICNALPHGDGRAVHLHWLNAVACQHGQAALVVELSIPRPVVDGTSNSDAQDPHGGVVLRLQFREHALCPCRGRAASLPEAARHRV